MSLDKRNPLPPYPWNEATGSSLADITDPKVGVLLLNLGGPETGEDVEGASISRSSNPPLNNTWFSCSRRVPDPDTTN